MLSFLRIIFVLLVTLMPAALSLAAPESHLRETGETGVEMESFILNQVNLIRERNGRKPLALSKDLCRVARSHSEDMARREILDHRGGDGRYLDERIASLPLPEWRSIGENVGCSMGHENDAETIVAGWRKSPPHLKNILSRDFESTGIGVALAEDGTLYATQVFMGSGEGNRQAPAGRSASSRGK